MDKDGRLAEIFADVTAEAPVKKKRVGADERPLTAQRNIPREVVNVMTSNQVLRHMVWIAYTLPKGTQAARLLRYMEDKGWRSISYGGRRMFYHGRSFKALDMPQHGQQMSLYGIYSVIRPKDVDDDVTKRLDVDLMKLWGVKTVGDTSDYVMRRSPSRKFMESITDEAAIEFASDLADQLYQHTGIVLEPASKKLPVGRPADPEDFTVTELPGGVKPDDIVVMAEGGMFYAVRAGKFGPGVVHDSQAVLAKGKTSVKMSPSDVPGDDPGHADMSKFDAGQQRKADFWKPSPGKDAQDLKRKLGMKEAADDDSVAVRGDGSLTKIVRMAASEGRKFIYLVGEVPGARGAKGRPEGHIDISPVPLRYERGGMYSEAQRVARRIRETGGLPVQAGKWSISDLGKYLRMFERDHGTQL